MTYKANSIVNVPVIAAENLTLFGETIYPIMNVNVSAVTTTIEGLPIVTVASGSNGQVLGTATLSVASTTGFSSPTGSLYCQDSPAGFASIYYEDTDATDFLQQYGQGGLLVAGYGVTTQNNVGTVDTTSNGLTLPQTTINIDSPYVTPPASGTMYIWTQSSSSGQVISYTSWVYVGPYYTFLGCSGGTTQLTGGGFGDLVFFTPYTTVTSPSAGTNLGFYTLYVNSTTGIPTPSGTSYIYSGGQIGYTGITGGGTPSFTGCYNGSGTVYTGDAITLGLPYTPLPVASTAGFPTSGTIFGSVAYTGTTSTSFTGVTGGTVTISNGQSVSLNTSCSWLGFPKGIPFTMGLRNTLSSGINPFLASASGNAASLISAETTIASGSNGQTLPQSVIYVASTTYYPPSGNLYITDSNGQELINYTSITGGGTPSFNGCTGGIGTLSTGDTVYPEFYNAVLTGLNNVTGIEQNNVAVGNAGSSSNNLGINGGNPIFINSTTAVGVNVGGTLPDPNNGSILWALTDYVYDGSVNVNGDGLPDSGNSIYYFVCDGYNVRFTQPVRYSQTYWSNENFTMNDGFNFEYINGQNLLYFTLSAGSLAAPFSFALPSNAFVTTITNTTSFDCTFGLTSGGTSFDTGGTTVIIAPGQAVIVGSDGTNVFFSNETALKPVRVNNGNSPYQIIEPPGVTYLVDTSGGAVTIYTPFNPVDGQTFTIKDSTGDWATNNLTITQIGTTVASGSSGQTLVGNDTIFVASTTGFPPTGTITVNDTNGNETITYTSITGGGTPSFNGCNGGTGTLATSDIITYGNDSIENIYSYTANIPPYSTSNPMFTGSGTYIGIPATLVLSVKGNSVTLTYGLTENTWFITEQLLAD